jgi:alpha-L-rhamnosidase
MKLKAGQKLILDFGEDIVGRPHIEILSHGGAQVECFFAEMLNDSGSLARGNDGPCGSAYIDNYRSALSRVQIITGGGEETFSPLYTFYGYRYLEIVADGEVEILDVESHIIGSDIRTTGHIETSNVEVNRLFDNVVRGLRGNYLSIPTDCPQRDERFGWTGDTQMFCGAAAYLADVDQFLNKWMMDLCDSQDEAGAYAFVAPRMFTVPQRSDGAAAWSDAGIIVPYKMWLMYGDTDILRNNFDSMERYMAFIKNDRGLDGPRPIYGDWLCYEETPKAYVSVCYYAYDALLMAKISRLLGKDDRAAYYEALRGEIIAHYLEQYITDGEINVKTQTGYLLPLTFEMVEGELREKTITALKKKIVDNDYTLSTGFVGTGYLNITLSAVGLSNEAYSLLLQTKDPSWLYSVRQGATTIWERWNSYNLDRGFGQVTMNSFNHYAYGAVIDWVYAVCGGINPVESAPGYEKVYIAPVADKRIDWLRVELKTAHGMVRSAWRHEGDRVVYEITTPVKATVMIEGKTYELEAGTYTF